VLFRSLDFCQSGIGRQAKDKRAQERSSAQKREQAVMRAYKTLGRITTAAVLGIATAAHAHTLRLECKKITNQDVVCRAITTDGELARNIDIQLLATGDYRVLATGKTNAAGEYAFKAPDVGYHIVATGDKAHVTNKASVDIW
jgi:hypothetical protein